MIEMKPVGYVKGNLSPENREYSGVSHIVIEEGLEEALDGIEEFSHLIIIFHLHLVAENLGNKIHPRHRQDLPLVGVFATHSQYRPNHIGLTIVELLWRKGRVLAVSNLDAFDGTPVLDIKPFIPPSIERVRQPDWVRALNEKV